MKPLSKLIVNFCKIDIKLSQSLAPLRKQSRIACLHSSLHEFIISSFNGVQTDEQLVIISAFRVMHELLTTSTSVANLKRENYRLANLNPN